MLLQCVYGIIHVKRGLTQKMLLLSDCTEKKWIAELGGDVGESHDCNCKQSGHSKLTISISAKAVLV